MPTSSVTHTDSEHRAVAELGDYVRDPNQRANCLGQGFDPATDVWHYEPATTDPDARRDYTARVAQACHGCPVRTACLVYALATEQTLGEVMPGAYGGLPSWERAALIRRAHAQGWQVVNTGMVRTLLANSHARTRSRERTSAPARVRQYVPA